ncbi:MAG: CBS domain-containing protein [Erythrobacter sp.]|nr:CBS domain-containing protein [Erythrobacter sp.]MDZ4273780.1 CBS domain-containing protein [Erythrobacter sp.]
MKIASIINRKGRHFETVREAVPLIEAVGIMHELSIGSIGVAANNSHEIIGIVSQPELMEAIATRGIHGLNLPVVIFVRRSILNCTCEDDASWVMEAMTRARSRHAIVRNQAGDVAGLVSMGDLVAALLEDAQLEAGVLRDMARSHLLSESV